jgi:hypothetical protein
MGSALILGLILGNGSSCRCTTRRQVVWRRGTRAECEGDSAGCVQSRGSGREATARLSLHAPRSHAKPPARDCASPLRDRTPAAAAALMLTVSSICFTRTSCPTPIQAEIGLRHRGERRQQAYGACRRTWRRVPRRICPLPASRNPKGIAIASSATSSVTSYFRRSFVVHRVYRKALADRVGWAGSGATSGSGIARHVFLRKAQKAWNVVGIWRTW